MRLFRVGIFQVGFVLLAALGIWLLVLGISITRFGETDGVETADAIVVLGAAVDDRSPSPVFEERIRHGVNLFRKGLAPILVFTGGRSEEDTLAESEAARRFAMAQGVPASAIAIETRSHTTRQNLAEAYLLVPESKSGREIVLVSDPLHLKRASLMARDLGLVAHPSPTPTTRYRSWSKKLPFLIREIYFYHHYLATGN